ncbi:MAG: endopeptidase La [Deltaproteobacteria bacterium]|nr:endopeptidase La [Deltaproteobacteria bacterium]MBW2121570.1 endopeptidase La [Deltaproteobacteria bacterium]
MGQPRAKDRSSSSRRHQILPLLPLRDIVVFPRMVVPLFVGREKSIRALQFALDNEKRVILATQKDAGQSDPAADDIYRVAVLGSIVQLLKLPDGTVKVLMEGQERVEIDRFVPAGDFLQAAVSPLRADEPSSHEVEALLRSAKEAFRNYIRLNPKVPPGILETASQIRDPGILADYLVAYFNLKIEDRQKLLETASPAGRLECLLGLIEGELEILRVEKKIESRIKKQIGKTQKEYYLNERIRAIRKELGERDEFSRELKELEDRIRKGRMSKEASQKVEKEFKKLRLMSPSSAEAAVVRSYIDWLLSLPWNRYTEEKTDIEEAESILEADHYGLKDVKERILEYLAVQRLVDRIKGPILCFVGPPGVGKTSLARSIARATGRNFVRLSLGGVRDEAEIRGHRRTYVGSMPGKIIQSIKKAGSSNPVFLLDEVDKMSADFRGDPSAALLEVLDPEQNQSFNDHYLGVDYDLSRVMFITTANTLQAVPPALRDRMEVIRIAGYTELEKLNIAKRFLIVKQREAHGLSPENLRFSEGSIQRIVQLYTREAGVRDLERRIASICRKVAKRVIKEGQGARARITARSLERYLGIPIYRDARGEKEDQIGMVNGLAWTEAGGELLVTEATVVPGKGNLIITGKLGEVMRESAQAAMTYVRSRAKNLGLEKDFYQKVDLHVHIPEGSIPKDGPSAGITIATAIVSALTRVPARNSVAMTGEITLRGRVIPVGGLKEKILAAHRMGIKTVLIPRENLKNTEEISPKIRKAVELVPVAHMDEVLRRSLALDEPRVLKEEREVMAEPLFAPPPLTTAEESSLVRH